MLEKMLDVLGLEIDSHRMRDDGATRYYVTPAGEDHWSTRKLRGQVYVANNDRTRLCMLSLDVGGDERDISVTAALPYVGYVSASLIGVPAELMRALGRTGRWDDKRQISLRVFNAALWWTIWKNPDHWSSTDPRWRSGSLQVLDVLFGRASMTETSGTTTRVQVPMPEGVYEGQVTMSRREWVRPRWPFRTNMSISDEVLYHEGSYYDIEVAGGIPEPGKGENSYDCGDDATYSQSGPGRTVEEAIGNLVASVLRTRMKRQGSHGWDRPAEKVA